MSDFEYETAEEFLARNMELLATHRKNIDNAEEILRNKVNPFGVQDFIPENFNGEEYTFVVGIPEWEYREVLGTLAEESVEAYFYKCRVEVDFKEAGVKAEYKKKKAWEKISEMIGVSNEELANPDTPRYEMAYNPETMKVMFFKKDPELSNEDILRALLGE